MAYNGLPIPVAEGGTGVKMFGAYAVVCAGTTSTGNLQNVASVGNVGDVLISNGAGFLPTFQPISIMPASITNLTNADSPYTVLPTDYYLSCDVSGGVLTILLPDAPSSGRTLIVKDNTGSAATNNITVTTVSGLDLIDGSTSYVINTTYESSNFIFNLTHYEVF
ncbi:MAG: hypothetical protein EPO02_13205 [Nitrospirae bacterium]|nr:MAG: hypothetical protein EPO02_13205 [Nitrospirota bacterium]